MTTNGGALRGAIAPVWDGNEVWLIVVGGVLFAAFPPVYAGVLSGFYLPFMLVVFALIIRAVSLGLHHGESERPGLRTAGFFLGSLVPSFLFGLFAGNLIRGVTLSPAGDHMGGLGELFSPFAVLIGFVEHGDIREPGSLLGRAEDPSRRASRPGAKNARRDRLAGSGSWSRARPPPAYWEARKQHVAERPSLTRVVGDAPAGGRDRLPVDRLPETGRCPRAPGQGHLRGLERDHRGTGGRLGCGQLPRCSCRPETGRPSA